MSQAELGEENQEEDKKFVTNKEVFYRPAGHIKRIAAAIIDSIIMTIALIPVGGIVGMIIQDTMNKAFVEFSFGLVLPAIAFSFMVSMKGTTIGKHIFGIKVLNDQTKTRPTLPKAILRELIGKYVSLLFLAGGYFWILFTEQRRGWHDLIANTVVVEEE